MRADNPPHAHAGNKTVLNFFQPISSDWAIPRQEFLQGCNRYGLVEEKARRTSNFSRWIARPDAFGHDLELQRGKEGDEIVDTSDSPC
jgi:hypothetical protein